MEALNTISTSTILFCNQMGTVLFNLGYTYSYVYVRFSLGLGIFYDMLKSSVYVPTLVGDFMMMT